MFSLLIFVVVGFLLVVVVVVEVVCVCVCVCVCVRACSWSCACVYMGACACVCVCACLLVYVFPLKGNIVRTYVPKDFIFWTGRTENTFRRLTEHAEKAFCEYDLN